MKPSNTLLSRKQLHERIPYSIAHVARLEQKGQFPRRVKIGPARVGWLADEVEEWIQKRVEERDDD